MRQLRTIDQQPISAACNSQLAALDSRERLERCTGRTAAIRTVTIEGILELVFNFVLNRPAQALAMQGTRAGGRSTIRHIAEITGP